MIHLSYWYILYAIFSLGAAVFAYKRNKKILMAIVAMIIIHKANLKKYLKVFEKRKIAGRIAIFID